MGMTKTAYPALSDRAQHLLKILVGQYIRDGQPVGSRTLSRHVEYELSPATIRNVMSDLEEMGLIWSPHTSAGRVPTARGYRIFVDSLLEIQPLNEQEISRLRSQLSSDESSEKSLLEQASNLLSEITRLAGVVMLPKPHSQTLRHVEFLSLSQQRVLVILVINEQEVQNRIIHVSREYRPAELQQAANYLNEAFTGKDIAAVRGGLLREMQEMRENLDRMMQAVIEMADKAFTTSQPVSDFLLAGQMNLLQAAELSNVEKLRHLFTAFTQKRDILDLLDHALNAQGVQIFIGGESGYQVLDECSVVAAPYRLDGQVIGVLGVIGPTRMHYERVIPIVDLTAKLLGAALAKH